MSRVFILKQTQKKQYLEHVIIHPNVLSQP